MQRLGFLILIMDRECETRLTHEAASERTLKNGQDVHRQGGQKFHARYRGPINGFINGVIQVAESI